MRVSLLVCVGLLLSLFFGAARAEDGRVMPDFYSIAREDLWVDQEALVWTKMGEGNYHRAFEEFRKSPVSIQVNLVENGPAMACLPEGVQMYSLERGNLDHGRFQNFLETYPVVKTLAVAYVPRNGSTELLPGVEVVREPSDEFGDECTEAGKKLKVYYFSVSVTLGIFILPDK